MTFFEALTKFRQDMLEFQITVMIVGITGTLLAVYMYRLAEYWVPYQFYKMDPQFMNAVYNEKKDRKDKKDWRVLFGVAAVLSVGFGGLVGIFINLSI